MTPERLLALYDRVADAPDAIARLRRFVLDLAVRGKLVEQAPADDSASELLQLLKAERPEVAAELPPKWSSVTLGSVLDFKYGKGLKASDRLEDGPVPVFGSNGIVGYTAEALTERSSIIIGRKGSAGALNLCAGPSWTTDVAYFVEAPRFLDLQFLFLHLQTLDLDKMGKGVKPGLSRSDAYPLSLSIPPLAEQHRIVAKVDALMALLDRLAAARAARETMRERLTTASLARLNAPDPEPATFQAHARFTLANLHPLTTRPDQIKPLRQTILNLAVRGKLVEQDPKEQAPDLPEQSIRGNAEGKLEFDLPSNWRWALVSEVASSRLGKMLDKAKNRGTDYPYLRNTNVHWFEIRTDDLKYIALSESEVPEYLLQVGDVLICEGGHGIGRSAVWRGAEQPMAFQKALHRVRTHDCLDPDFFAFCCFIYYHEGVMQTYFTGVGIPHFTGKALSRLIFPLPPLAEQHRIVAKVDALMALLDRLEASLAAADTTRRHLLEALLHEALAPVAEVVTKAAE